VVGGSDDYNARLRKRACVRLEHVPAEVLGCIFRNHSAYSQVIGQAGIEQHMYRHKSLSVLGITSHGGQPPHYELPRSNISSLTECNELKYLLRRGEEVKRTNAEQFGAQMAILSAVA